jgi:hypothetical protein
MKYAIFSVSEEANAFLFIKTTVRPEAILKVSAVLPDPGGSGMDDFATQTPFGRENWWS